MKRAPAINSQKPPHGSELWREILQRRFGSSVNFDPYDHPFVRIERLVGQVQTSVGTLLRPSNLDELGRHAFWNAESTEALVNLILKDGETHRPDGLIEELNALAEYLLRTNDRHVRDEDMEVYFSQSLCQARYRQMLGEDTGSLSATRSVASPNGYVFGLRGNIIYPKARSHELYLEMIAGLYCASLFYGYRLNRLWVQGESLIKHRVGGIPDGICTFKYAGDAVRSTRRRLWFGGHALICQEHPDAQMFLRLRIHARTNPIIFDWSQYCEPGVDEWPADLQQQAAAYPQSIGYDQSIRRQSDLTPRVFRQLGALYYLFMLALYIRDGLPITYICDWDGEEAGPELLSNLQLLFSKPRLEDSVTHVCRHSPERTPRVSVLRALRPPPGAGAFLGSPPNRSEAVAAMPTFILGTSRGVLIAGNQGESTYSALALDEGLLFDCHRRLQLISQRGHAVLRRMELTKPHALSEGRVTKILADLEAAKHKSNIPKALRQDLLGLTSTKSGAYLVWPPIRPTVERTPAEKESLDRTLEDLARTLKATPKDDEKYESLAEKAYAYAPRSVGTSEDLGLERLPPVSEDSVT